MIARTWRGTTRESDADRYLNYLHQTGLRSYRATPGNVGVFVLRRIRDGRAEFFLISFWDSPEAVGRFAGADPERAVFYPEDEGFLLQRDLRVHHFEVVYAEWQGEASFVGAPSSAAAEIVSALHGVGALSREARGIADDLFGVSAAVRYVAIYRRGKLYAAQRPDIENASASESDKYEELIVNPTLLTLLAQRGDIDCGGLRFVLVRYGNFYQLVRSINGGHVSIGIQPDGDPMALVSQLDSVLAEHRFSA